MSRSRSAVTPLRTGFGESLSEADLRRQLEGRVELVDAARADYGELQDRLDAFRWKRQLREAPTLLRRIVEREPGIDEALERIARRAASDGWPEDAPILRRVRELQERRTELHQTALKRLRRLRGSGAQKTDSLAATLTALSSLALEPIPGEPAGTEVLLQGGLGGSLAVDFGMPIITSVGIIANQLDADWLLATAFVLVGVWAAYGYVRSGKFWVTRDRVIWKPYLGEPEQVSLASIAPGGVRVRLWTSDVIVQGSRRMKLRMIENARKLGSLLELRRAPPLLGAPADAQVSDVALYRGKRVLSGARSERTQGFILLRPDFAAFFPDDAGRRACEALTGVPTRVDVEVETLVRQLTCLEPAAFDREVQRICEVAGGSVLRRGEATHDASIPPWSDIPLRGRDVSLHGEVDWRQIDVANRVLVSWHPETARRT